MNINCLSRSHNGCRNVRWLIYVCFDLQGKNPKQTFWVKINFVDKLWGLIKLADFDRKWRQDKKRKRGGKNLDEMDTPLAWRPGMAGNCAESYMRVWRQRHPWFMSGQICFVNGPSPVMGEDLFIISDKATLCPLCNARRVLFTR